MTTHGPLSPDVVDLVDHTVTHNHSGAPTDNPGGPHGNRNPGTALLRTARPEPRRRSGGLTRVRSSRGVHRRSPQPPWRTITLGTRAPGRSGRPTFPAVVLRGHVQRIPTPSGCDPPNRKAHRRRSGAGGYGRTPPSGGGVRHVRPVSGTDQSGGIDLEGAAHRGRLARMGGAVGRGPAPGAPVSSTLDTESERN